MSLSEKIETLIDRLLESVNQVDPKEATEIRNTILRVVVGLLDGVEPHGSNINKNNFVLGDLTYQIECFIEE